MSEPEARMPAEVAEARAADEAVAAAPDDARILRLRDELQGRVR
ncbi:MAG: hypothetical protein ACRELA_09275 [Candidatus Rokuibacteriota bacterium]